MVDKKLFKFKQEQAQKMSTAPKDKKAVFQMEENQVYRSISSEFFRDRFELDLTILVTDIEKLGEKIAEVTIGC